MDFSLQFYSPLGNEVPKPTSKNDSFMREKYFDTPMDLRTAILVARKCLLDYWADEQVVACHIRDNNESTIWYWCCNYGTDFKLLHLESPAGMALGNASWEIERQAKIWQEKRNGNETN